MIIICKSCGGRVPIMPNNIVCCFDKQCVNWLKYATISTEYFNNYYLMVGD